MKRETEDYCGEYTDPKDMEEKAPEAHSRCRLGAMPVTIVVPVLNREVIVERCLASIESQDIRPLKVVLVDNGSTDGSLSKLESWARRVKSEDIEARVITEPERGAAKARNAGLEMVETPWVMFFDSDDELRTDHLRRLVGAMRECPDANLIGWDVVLHFPDGRRRLKYFPERHLYRNVLFAGKMSTQSYAVETRLVKEAGGWNNRLGCWDDIELAVRLLDRRPVIRRLDGQWVDVMVSDDSITGPDFKSRAAECIESLRILAKYYPGDMLGDIDLKKIILAGNVTAEHSPLGDGIFIDVMKHARGRRHRLALRLAYMYVSRGYRGIARIFHPMM